MSPTPMAPRAVNPKEEYFNAATLQDTEYSDIFFADVLVGSHEPDQTYQIFDDSVNNYVNKRIVRGDELLHVCNDNVPVTAPIIQTNKGSRVYQPYPISIAFPPSGTDRIEVVQFVIDNIDRTLVDIVRRLQYPLEISIARGFVKSALSAKRDGVCTILEQRLTHLSLIDITITSEIISGQLVVDTVMWKKHPNNHELYQHHNFPGLWGLDPDDLP